jgi:hypothetical protein
VADNASVNGKIAQLMQEPYPWILHLPCASHTLQLCIVRLFEQDSTAESIKSVVRDVVRAISHSNVRLTEFLRVQGDQPVHLVKPQKTRWSSYYLACAAVLKLRPFVELALRKLADDNEHAVMSKLTVTFWSKIGDLVAFLEPFAFASNVIQSDQASLLDVHVQFSRLLPSHLKCSSVAESRCFCHESCHRKSLAEEREARGCLYGGTVCQ